MPFYSSCGAECGDPRDFRCFSQLGWRQQQHLASSWRTRKQGPQHEVILCWFLIFFVWRACDAYNQWSGAKLPDVRMQLDRQLDWRPSAGFHRAVGLVFSSKRLLSECWIVISFSFDVFDWFSTGQTAFLLAGRRTEQWVAKRG